MKITERKIVRQTWYEPDITRADWKSDGWSFDNGEKMDNSWTIVSHLTLDKYYNSWVGIAEREVDV
jgi:hypothetical protein